MHAEQQEVAQFLSQYAPFDALEKEAVEELAQQIEVAYYRAGSQVLSLGEPIADLYVIRSGGVELSRRNGELYNRLSKGGVFGQMGLLMNRKVRFAALALEDTLLYCIPVSIFNDFCDRYEAFADYFETDGQSALHQAVTEQANNNDLTTAKVKSLLHRDAVTVSAQETVQAVAMRMNEEMVTSVLVMSDHEATSKHYHVLGIVTDKDIREKVVAQGLGFDLPVSEIMSTQVQLVDTNTYVFEAVLTMLRDNVHHLPVVKQNKPIGVISLSDIIRYESQSSLLFVRGIMNQLSVADLSQFSKQVPGVFTRMVNEDANSHMIGTAMAVIGRTFKQRLLELAEEELGPPPVPYCFIALGSMAREEQLIVTDQDNAIILDDSYDDAQHNSYFQALADFVCDGLALCGYRYCDGEIMASFKKWRMTRLQWRETFKQWMDEPNPKALLNSSIFFDLSGVRGETHWAQELQEFIAEYGQSNRRFLANIAANARNRTPPLGFFKSFVLEPDGEHKKSMNLKRRGTAPLSDVIRVHAIAAGSQKQNSFERLEDILEANILPQGKAQDLVDALEYITMVRIRHQCWQIEQGEDEPDNSIDPALLTPFERRNLKEAFAVLEKAQSFLKFRYQVSNGIN